MNNTQPIVNSSKRKRMLNDFYRFSKTGTQLARKWSGHDLNFNIRVWSWLRMNAGGVLNTCKSNEENLIESFGRISFFLSGGRVSNVWATCPVLWNNHWKRWLIPHVITGRHLPVKKGAIRYRMGPHLCTSDTIWYGWVGKAYSISIKERYDSSIKVAAEC